ncbi:uncharacterized protein EV422DRAFT_617490 [Fimicolochytrium jonesii]|uniref:uncharacterized protein n=1 Tax=Fimicolochytrium jonesii TaxID=1396493 RepID=UPI0022FECDD9|nr:uncharacterized protein EV422DRAFT_617490 [Fimicolochytrium jonesii]KAI8825058.1 hypothetical protein EV422DRAFT_617490 [Fimicolochytrium jonesii]
MHELRSPTQVSHIPFLPGNTIRDVTKNDFRVPHTLDYKNGYAIKHIELPPDLKSPHQLLKSVGSDPRITYDGHLDLERERRRGGAEAGEGKFVPAHVVFDKVVLRFDAYFKQTVHESVEKYHLRRVRILYYVEDDSIAVVEPPVENSGIPQGVLIKRQRLPRSSTEYFSVRDFNLGINVTFYGKTFRIIGCDAFTREYMQNTEHIYLNNPEPMPHDPHEELRSRPTRTYVAGSKGPDKLKRFLENDRKVLRFFCVWDDRGSMFGELREFIMHYYLVDDSVEVREVQKPNNGRDPFPILLRRQQLPKPNGSATDPNEGPKYTWKDFRVGGAVDILGRPFLIRDCDEYTRRFYTDKLHLPSEELQPLNIAPQAQASDSKASEEVPPYNGFGSVEDSLGSVKYLVLKPPKKDFIKMLENEHKVLRFVARLNSKHREDQDRRFVISYRLADDMMTIYEPPQRNAGVIGGKFMERTRVLLPGSSLTDPGGPRYYDATDLHVGATVTVFAHQFVLLDADEYVYNYMESNPTAFPSSNISLASQKARALSITPEQRSQLAEICTKDAVSVNVVARRGDGAGRGGGSAGAGAEATVAVATGPVVERGAFVEAWRRVVGVAGAGGQISGGGAPAQLTDHELITLARQYEPTPRHVDYTSLLAAL